MDLNESESKRRQDNNSHHPAERFCEGDGAASVVFSEGSIVPIPLSPAHLISNGPLVSPQLTTSRILVHLTRQLSRQVPLVRDRC